MPSQLQGHGLLSKVLNCVPLLCMLGVQGVGWGQGSAGEPGREGVSIRGQGQGHELGEPFGKPVWGLPCVQGCHGSWFGVVLLVSYGVQLYLVSWVCGAWCTGAWPGSVPTPLGRAGTADSQSSWQGLGLHGC